MMILVDTNVFSETFRPVPDANVVEWLYANRNDTLLSTIVVAELEIGVRTTSGAAKRRMLSAWLDRLIERHVDRIAPFDLAAARRWGQIGSALLIAEQRSGSRAFDSLLAAQALALDVPLATRNVRHFDETGLTLINPWND